jgi:hypothetical protein
MTILVNTVMKFWVPQNVGDSLSGWATISFSKTQLHVSKSASQLVS